MDSDFSAEQQLGDDNSSLTYCFLNAMDACYHQQSMPSPQAFHAKSALGGNAAVSSAMAGSYSSFDCHDPTVAAKPLRHPRFSDSFLGGSEFGCGVIKGAGRGMYEGSVGMNGNISSAQPHAAGLKNVPKGWANLEAGVRVSDSGMGVIPGALAQFHPDTAFAGRAAKFSSSGDGIRADSPRNKADDHERNPKEDAICEVSNLGPVLENDTGNLPDFSEQANCADDSLGRKRKAEKGTRNLSAAQEAKESEEVKAKRCKVVQHSDSEYDNGNSSDSTPKKGKEKDSKFPPKEDYIHVRARRGQATDSHSLAERVRREKINERMKFLQDLVPSCNKVTGKAVMLDEIINYVQSLQHQVEFLSMKLAAVNPKLDFNINNVFPKEMCGSIASQGVSPPYLPPDQFKQTSLQTLPSPGSDVPSAMSSADSAEVFADTNFQMQSPWDSELQNLIHMGFVQGRLQHYQAL